MENLIELARGIKLLGVKKLDFNAFDTKKIDEYEKQAKATWGQTKEFKEFEEKRKEWNDDQWKIVNVEFMGIFADFGKMIHKSPSDELVQQQVNKLQDYITEHFYTCSLTILKELGKMYAGGGSMTENIDKAGGKGTAEFVEKAIEEYCR